MAKDGFVQLPPDSTGKRADAASISVGAATVYRQRIIIADNIASATFATILSSGPAGTEGGLVVRNIPSGTQTVAGTVSLGAGTANIGSINNISATIAAVLAAGTANIGSINNISANVNVVVQAGANNIGTINNISATVNTGISFVLEKTTGSQVQVGDSANAALRVNVVAGSASGPSNVDNTTYSTGATTLIPAGFVFFSASATVVTDGRVAAARITDSRAQHINLRNNAGTEVGTAANPLSVNVQALSATASVILAAGTANIGTIQAISATVMTGVNYFLEKTSNAQVQVGDSLNAALRVNLVADFLSITNAVPSASHGPKLVTVSTSAVVALVAAPGANLSIYVTMIACSNASGTNTRAYIKESASAVQCMFMAANGGGFVIQYDPPWKLSANTVLNGNVDPAVSDALFNVNFFVAA